MVNSRKRLLLILLSIAILLIVLGIALTPVVNGIDPKIRADNVILNGIPFILIAIGVIILFIDFIIWLASKLNNNIPEKTYRPIERALIVGIALGVIGMFQPFTVVLYTLGFIVLLVSTLGFIVWSHVVPRITLDRATRTHDGLGSVSISEIEQREVQG